MDPVEKFKAGEATPIPRPSIYSVESSPRKRNTIVTMSLSPEKPGDQSEVAISPTRGNKQAGTLSLADLEEKADISSSLLAQHFSLLRELHQYCLVLKENVGPESGTFSPEEAWKNFGHLVELLEAGCDFLHYPVRV